MVASGKTVWLLALVLLLLPLGAWSGEPEPLPDSRVEQALRTADEMRPGAEAAAEQERVTAAEFRVMQEKHKVYLLLGLLVVTPIFLFLELCYIKSTSYTAENVVNGTGLVLIIQATLLVVIASPTSEQLTAAIGVLGAIAGYLFGSTRRQADTGRKEHAGKTEG
ncbi:MAG TPA: hypothetical protein ENK27_10285 [Desulfobulbus sp.]|nr:hypothetical protein [Desulfobulbus sp.]